ncbi:MAG: 5-formyltetrahydrofolate cyclo-ligase, partial [Magnetococcales bacterium]|nr:5-formyltetrahydrofolate cyclo-ligase [Magnetococcales bacterium]
RSVCARVIAAPWYRRAGAVGVYVATDGEVDPSDLLADALQGNKQVFLPVTDRQGKSLSFVRYLAETPLRVGAFGIPEPVLVTGTEVLATPRGIDLLLVPLVGFDRQGGRLGYGGGFFDRFLATPPRPFLVGLAYGFQEVSAIPCEPFDVRLDAVATEREILTCGPLPPCGAPVDGTQ